MKRFNQNRFIGSIYCSDLIGANMFRFIQKMYSRKQVDGFIAQIYPKLPTCSSLRVFLPNRADSCAGAQRANQACKSVAVWRCGDVAAWRRVDVVDSSVRLPACQPASLPACRWPAGLRRFHACLVARENHGAHEMNKSEQ